MTRRLKLEENPRMKGEGSHFTDKKEEISEAG